LENGDLLPKKGSVDCSCHGKRDMGGGRDALREFLRELLTNPAHVIVGHNLGFDFAVLVREFPEMRELFVQKCTDFQVLDTQTIHALMYPDYNGQRSLKKLAATYVGANLDKGAVRTSFRRGTVLSMEQKSYAVSDAVVTECLAQELLTRFSRTGYGSLSPIPEEWRLHKVACKRTEDLPAALFLYSAASVLKNFTLEARGLKVDPEDLKKLHDEAQAIVDAKLKDLVGHGLARAGRALKSEVTEVEDLDEHYRGSSWTWNGRGHVFRARDKWEDAEPSSEDLATLAAAGADISRIRKTRVRRRVFERAPAKITLNNRKLVEAYDLFATENKINPPRTPKEEVSLEYDFWKQYKAELPEGLRTHLEVGKARKLLSTYFRPMKEALDKGAELAFPSYGVGLTETGRWSCFRPNIQNQPKSIRHMYRSPYKSHVLIGADYKSLELYTLCHCMGKMGIVGPLYDALASEDVHTTTAALLLCKDVADVTKDERQAAKACNFGLPGGLGPRTFAKQARQAYGLDWDVDKAREMKERWLEAYPDVAEYMGRFRVHPLDLRHYSQTRRQFLESLGFDPRMWPSVWDIQERMNQGKLYTCTLPSGRVVPNRRYSQAMNLFFQGTGADVITLAYVRAEEAGLLVVAVVHDSITVSAPEAMGECGLAMVQGKLEAVMAQAQREVCTHAPDPSVEAEIRKEWF
jgi:hypothetical protein